MMKALRLFLVGCLFASFTLHAQQQACGTPAPSQQWEEWFGKQVENYLKNRALGKAQLVNYTIPVVVHVIHYNHNYGTYPNIDSNQIKSQIDVLNKDFAGIGNNVQNVPSYFQSLVANTGIKFCLARIHGVTNAVLTEKGVDRVNAQANAWTNPSTATLNIYQYMNTVIIPATIWDPNKYLNIWVSDKPTTETLNGFATYPSNTTVPGLFNGSFGTSTNDGIWVWAKAFGTVGTLQAPYNKGRTATHELGHWLGLRHIWGDGNCLSDYCTDTPVQKGPTSGCITSTAPDLCGTGTSPNGAMVMNFMDMTEDDCKYMFTWDQNLRMQAAMSQCPQRNLLGTHSLCTPTNVPASTSGAVANFVLNSDQCTGSPVTPYNTSSGYPNPTYLWSSSPAVSFTPAATVANPAIIFPNPGTYTITLVATNSLSSNTHTQLVTTTFSCSPFNICIDTLKAIKPVDTLASLQAPFNANITECSGTGYRGALAGTNCYSDRALAQYFGPSTFTAIPNPQVSSILVLFHKNGTKSGGGNSTISAQIYGGNSGTGPTTSNYAAAGALLSSIISSTNTASVGYLGNGIAVSGSIIPYRFDFPIPVLVNVNSGFYAGISLPYTSPNDSIRVLTNTKFNSAVDSSAWFQASPSNNWRTFRTFRNSKIQLAIIPIMSCSGISGVKENALLSDRVFVIPNPSEGQFQLALTLANESDVQINIYTTMGQLVKTNTIKQVTNTLVDVDLSEFSDGIYYVEVTTGGQRAVKKVVIQH